MTATETKPLTANPGEMSDEELNHHIAQLLSYRGEFSAHMTASPTEVSVLLLTAVVEKNSRQARYWTHVVMAAAFVALCIALMDIAVFFSGL